jgi:hypothetical protein
MGNLCASCFDGDRYSVKTLQRQVHFDILISFTVFIGTQIASAILTPFWRPIGYDIGWAILAFLIGIFGLVGVQKKSSALLVVFSVLLVMLACLNISHVLTMRSEHVHTCRLNQNTFRNCATEPSLQHCINANECKRDELLKTSCKAPGREHCDELGQMDLVFAANMFISFLTFAEPTFWALLLLIRMEMTFPITPDEDDMESEEPDEKKSLLADAEDKADSKSEAPTGTGTGAYGTDSYQATDTGESDGSLRWI